ncbi:ABC transporter permease [Chitinophaga silvatica]|uniref:ABC transporter permease n=1 Tax=Chitinophaga silvatica TaxID=2282649 RepID=A0A3E1YAR2_9BACT|nr:ABC transporter permease [Chitinophaga silvatica]RFS22765.1 ABC transporter permease [Chitinophaga silvatica]
MFKNYLKIAFRNLTRNKIYSFINIAGLTIGLTCAMLIILYIKDDASFDRFQNNKSNIYRVVLKSAFKGEEHQMSSTGLFQGPRFAQNVSGIKGFVRVHESSADFKKGSDVENRQFLYVDSSFLFVFTFPLIEGDAKTCLSNPNSIVLTKDEAIKQFGTATAVGKILTIREDDAFVPYQVTAVTENCPQNSTIQYKMLIPIKVSEEENKNNENWFSFYLNTFVVLDDHANPDYVSLQMQKFFEKDAGETSRALDARFGRKDSPLTTYFLQPFLDIHLSKDLPAKNGLQNAGNPIYAYILSGIALFVLLIANINFINLTVARSVKRSKEIGIRKVIGSDRRQLIVQFLGESFILCAIAFILAILLAQLILPLFNELANKKLAMSYLFDFKLIAGYILLFLFTGLLAGFYPALILSGYQPIDTLYSRFTLKGKNYMQRGLVILQFTLASFLIIGTFTIYSQFSFLTKAKLGYDDNNIVVVKKDNMTHEKAAIFKHELLNYPDIEQVAPKNGGFWGTSAKLDSDSSINFAWETIDESYIQTLKIPIVMGRNFSEKYPGDSTHSILVNESFVKQAGWTNPIGKSVIFNYRNNKTYEVVGVVKDHHFTSLNEKIRPQLFTMANNNPYGTFYIKIRPNTATRSLKFIEAKFKQFFPFTPYSYVFKNEENLKNYESEARWKQIILFGAILTISISCIGLFGLSVLSAEKSYKAIGIRKVLGASVQNIATGLALEFVKLVIIALVIAFPLAWLASNKWLDSYPYRIRLDWSIFAGAAILVLLIAIATVSIQAIKAATANPVKCLRSE